MKEHPDSSLALLQSIDTTSLHRQIDKARYDLLLTEALDKNYIDIRDDARIQRAAEYFLAHGEKGDQLKTYYYLGVIHRNAHHYTDAAIDFHQAEPLAAELGDNHRLGLIYLHMSKLYTRSFDHDLAIRYMQKSVEAYETAGEEYAADFSRFYLAQNYTSIYQTAKAQDILFELEKKYTDTDDILYAYVERQLAQTFLIQRPRDYEMAQVCLTHALENRSWKMNLKDLSVSAQIAAYYHQDAQADIYLAQMASRLRNAIDSTDYFNTLYNVYDIRKDYKSACEVLGKTIAIEKAGITSLLKHSVSHTLSAFDTKQLQAEKEITRRQRIIYFLVFVVILSTAGICLAAFRQKNNRLLEEMSRMQDIFGSMEEQREKDSAIRDIIDRFVRDKISSLNSIANSYFSWEDSSINKREKKEGKYMKDELVYSFRKQWSELRDVKGLIPSLEDYLNSTDDELMKRLKSELGAGLKQEDYNLLIMMFSGFSIKSIAFISLMSEAAVRMRKTRFKHLFETLPEPLGPQCIRKLGYD